MIANLSGDDQTILFVLDNTNFISFAKRMFENDTAKIKIIRKLAWILGNIGTVATFLTDLNSEKYNEVLHFSL